MPLEKYSTNVIKVLSIQPPDESINLFGVIFKAPSVVEESVKIDIGQVQFDDLNKLKNGIYREHLCKTNQNGKVVNITAITIKRENAYEVQCHINYTVEE